MMKIKKYLYLIAIALLFISVESCKKKTKDTVTIKPDMGGILNFDITYFLSGGETLTLEPKEDLIVKSGEIKYSWRVSWNEDLKSNSKTFKFKIPNKIGEYKVTLTATCDGYNPQFTTKSVLVLNDKLGKSLTETGITEDMKSFVDSRDNTKYHYITSKSGTQWMVENLAYNPNTKTSSTYRNAEVMRKIYGYYYNWKDAQNACPEGWTLPSDEDWTTLAKEISNQDFKTKENFNGVAGAFMVKALLAGKKLWQYWPQVKITNSSKMAVLPCGYAVIENDTFIFQGGKRFAAFWTSDEADSQAYYRYFNEKEANIMINKADKNSFAINIRCIKK